MKQKTISRRDYVKMKPTTSSSYNVRLAPYYCEPMRNNYKNTSAYSNTTGGPRASGETPAHGYVDRDDVLNRRY